MSENNKADLAKLVIAELENDPMKGWAVFRDRIRNDPEPMAQHLSIEIPNNQAVKHFVDIARSRGKGAFIR